MRKILMMLCMVLVMTATTVLAGGGGRKGMPGPNQEVIIYPYACVLTISADTFGGFINDVHDKTLLSSSDCSVTTSSSSEATYSCKTIVSKNEKHGASSSYANFQYVYQKGTSHADVCKWFVEKYKSMK